MFFQLKYKELQIMRKSFEIALDQKAAMRYRLAAKSLVGASLVGALFMDTLILVVS